MGLDITAYSDLRPRPDLDPDDEKVWDGEGYIVAGAYAGFDRSTRGLLNHDVVSEAYNTQWVARSVYQQSPATETHQFRAGSYGGYSMFREMLADCAGLGHHAEAYHHDGDPEWPFYELINFADNEGTIGPWAAKDLLEDFKAYRAAFASINPEWAETYDDWVIACELAAQDGLIHFH